MTILKAPSEVKQNAMKISLLQEFFEALETKNSTTHRDATWPSRKGGAFLHREPAIKVFEDRGLSRRKSNYVQRGQ
jgi:hypothetical protein